jgi:UDP-N-acetylmuramate--alanine ligase
LLEVYPASEAPILGVTSALIAKSLEPSKVLIEPSMISMVAKVVLEAKSGDVILTLGAGDVSSLAPVIVNALSE